MELEDAPELTFRFMELPDFDEYLKLKSDEEDVIRSGYADQPNRDRLFEWVTRELSNPHRFMFTVLYNSAPQEILGYLYIMLSGDAREFAETSAGVSRKFRGRHYGRDINLFALRYTQSCIRSVRAMIGWIAFDNVKAIWNVLNIGYYDSGETKTVTFQYPEVHEKAMKKFLFDIRR